MKKLLQTLSKNKDMEGTFSLLIIVHWFSLNRLCIILYD